MYFSPANERKKSLDPSKIFLVGATLLSILLIWYGAAGLRGTDQYWYIADVLSISEGAAHLTNNYFPGPMLRDDAVTKNNYFMHNNPVMVFIAGLTNYMEAYCAWILVNVMFHLLVALCVFKVTAFLAVNRIATIVTGLYLFSPIAIWQTINPLLEMYFSALLALQVLCFFFRDRFIYRAFLYIFFLLGVVSHPIFLVPALLWGIWSLYEFRQAGIIFSVAVCALYYMCLLRFMDMKDVWFPTSFQPNLKAIVASVVPGKSNMIWHYSEFLPVVDLQLMRAKLVSALSKHLLIPKFAPLYVFTNLALLSACFLTVLHFKRWWRTLFPLGIFGLQYVALICLQQNHPRFQQIIAAVTFILIGIGLYQLTKRTRNNKKYETVALAGVFVLLFSVSLFIANVGRKESIGESAEVKRMIQEFSILSEDARIVGIDIKPHNPFSYIVRPRPMLFIRTDLLDEKGIVRAIELFKPNYLIVKRDKRNVDGTLIAGYKSSMFGELELYRVGG